MEPLEFIRKYRLKMHMTVDTVEHSELIDDVRDLVVGAQVKFRENQVAGEFTDGTGDLYLAKCQEAYTK